MAMIGVLFFFSASVLYADYNSMKDDFHAYTPPKDFAATRKHDTQSEKLFQALDPSKLGQLKKDHEEKLSGIKALVIAMGIDESAFDRFLKTSSNQNTLIKDLVKPLGQKLSRKELIIIAALRNPEILAAQKKVMAQIQSFDQVMYLDNTLALYASFTGDLDNRVGPLKRKNSIKMAYPSPGLTALKGRIIQNQVNMLTEKMSIVQKKILRDVEKAYWDFVFNGQSTQIIQATIAAFERLEDVATALYKSGKTSFQDVIKISIKIEELKEDLNTLNSKKKNIEIRILELLNLPTDTSLGRAAVAPLPPKAPQAEDLFPIAMEHRQELRAIRFQISKLEAMVEMAESMIESPLTLGFSNYEKDLINTTGSDAPKQAFAMKNTQPVKPFYGVDKPWLAQTRQTLLSLCQTLVSRENATKRMVRTAWFFTDKNRRELHLYQNRILDLAKSALDVSTREYETGSIPFSQAIDSYTYWLKVKLTIAKKQADLGISFADLENIVGRTLSNTRKTP